MVEKAEAAYWIVRLIERGLETLVKRGSCYSLIVAARTVRAAEGQVVEVALQSNRSGIPQVV